MRVPGVMLRDTLSVEPYTGQAGAAGPTFGAAVTVRAHVEPKRRLLRTIDGEEVVSTAIAYLRPDVEIPARSRVTWKTQTLSVLAEGVLRDTVLELALGGAGAGA